MIGIENGYPVGMDIGRVKEFAERGGRYMSLAHNGHSQLSDSNTGEALEDWLHGGLSDLGKEVVSEMNRWGIMIDLSHPSKEANLQTLELSRAPVIASHSAARALGDHSRNMDDEQLLALKENGGVVQTVAFRSYLRPDKDRAFNEAAQSIMREVAEERGFELPVGGRRAMFMSMQGMDDGERETFMQEYQDVQAAAEQRMADMESMPEPVSVADLVDHIDYLVELIGLEHVGISSDFDGGGGVAGGVHSLARWHRRQRGGPELHGGDPWFEHPEHFQPRTFAGDWPRSHGGGVAGGVDDASGGSLCLVARGERFGGPLCGDESAGHYDPCGHCRCSVSALV